MTSSAQIHVMELASKGYACPQIVMAYALKAMDTENPQLIRAMSGIKEGAGGTGNICGALSGGFCLISLYLGKGRDDEQKSEKEAELFKKLHTWFKEQNSNHVQCNDLLADMGTDLAGEMKERTKCPTIITGVCEKVISLLAENGIDPSERV